MQTTEDFMKKYANLLDPSAQACQTSHEDCTGESCTIEMCSTCGTEESCGVSKTKQGN
ncbi:MAG: hypothetical protein LBT84_04870 [Spirochaetia bacterium]|nr:hypothetical protein [Spirochaetia bacterium]